MNYLKTKYSFWLYKSKKNSKNESPIYMRIIVGKEYTELSTGIYIQANNWDNKTGKIKGQNLTGIDILNLKLDNLAKAFNKVLKNFLEADIPFTPQSFKNRLLGIDVNIKSLIELFTDHNKEMEKLKGIDYSNSTCQRYATTLTHVKEFIKVKLKVPDILITHLTVKFIKDFITYLKIEKGHNQNTAGKYAKNLKKVLNTAIVDGLIDKNPLMGFKIKNQETNMEFLTLDELKKIEDKVFDIERMENIRKCFLFQCYTGLAYVDLEKLTKNNLVEKQGQLWIESERTKTKVRISVPLSNKAVDILKSFYEGKRLLPVPTNQRYNVYLKELADTCQISKNLCTHTARRTAATSFLTKGVSIDVVSKLLSHKRISTTQIYAKVVDEKILNEFKKWND